MDATVWGVALNGGATLPPTSQEHGARMQCWEGIWPARLWWMSAGIETRCLEGARSAHLPHSSTTHRHGIGRRDDLPAYQHREQHRPGAWPEHAWNRQVEFPLQSKGRSGNNHRTKRRPCSIARAGSDTKILATPSAKGITDKRLWRKTWQPLILKKDLWTKLWSTHSLHGNTSTFFFLSFFLFLS